jgi:hemerythrin
MISSSNFYDLLDCLAGQFFKTGSAHCVGKEFGVNISLSAQEYFSTTITPIILPDKIAVFGALLDDSVHVAGRKGFTFVIYIDPLKINKDLYEVYSRIILAHEICHFSFYYELFLGLGDNTGDDIGIVQHSRFINTLRDTFNDIVIQEQDETSVTKFDAHEIDELIKNFKSYPENHFTNGLKTKINYRKLFNGFLNHLHFNEKLDEYHKRRGQNKTPSTQGG